MKKVRYQMPHSLRAKIKGLRYKGIITDKDCDRLCKALDNEGVLDKIEVEIKALTDGAEPERIWNVDVLGIINKHRK